MIRLFVAVVLPPPVRDRLLAAMGGVAGARWQRDDHLHLTLRFIGEVDRHIAQDIVAALAAVRHPSFEVAVEGVGTFASRGRPNTIWAGVTPVAEIAALHRKVDQALIRAGIPADSRAFHPHITLARLSRSAGPVTNFLSNGIIKAIGFSINEVQLFESVLTSEGSEYHSIERYMLTPMANLIP